MRNPCSGLTEHGSRFTQCMEWHSLKAFTCLAEKGPSSLMKTVLRGVPSTGAMTRLKVCRTLRSVVSSSPL